jgi:hypothetical protein
MTLEELKDEVYYALENKPRWSRDGQFVFNYIDEKYQVARQIQFQDNVDCFYNDDEIDAFLKCAVERINN